MIISNLKVKKGQPAWLPLLNCAESYALHFNTLKSFTFV